MAVEIGVAFIVLAGGITTELIRRGFNRQEKNEQELKAQLKALQAKVEELIDEVDQWKQKYYLLLKELTEKNK